MKISENTVISWSVFVVVVGVAFGAGKWMTAIWSTGEANAKEIIELKLSKDKTIDALNRIEQSTARIEERLNSIERDIRQ